MPIIYGAIVPHSPVLLSTIGKQITDQLANTLQSMESIACALSALQADTIVLLTNPDSKRTTDTLIVQTSDLYRATFETFGDFATNYEIKCDTVLGLHIKKGFEEDAIPVSFQSEEKLDYSASVPLILLRATRVKLVVVQPPDLPNKQLMEYGATLQHILQKSDKRIAVIASGDLSHSLTEKSPLGLNLEGTIIDQDIIALFRSRKLHVRKIYSFPKEAAVQAGVCGLNAFVVLAGILHHMNFKAHFYTYEGPLGVGHCVIAYTF